MSAVIDWAGLWLDRAREALLALRGWPWLDTYRTLRERFREDRLGLTAGSLTFTTLIALVPLLTVMLAVFTAFPMFSSFQGALEQYFLQSLVPEGIARPVLRSLNQFAAKARGMGSLGLVLLLATALALMLTIDRTLNAIWRVRKPRPIGQRVLVYWAALTLGPLVLGVSLSGTSYAISASKGLVGAMPGSVEFVFELLQFVLIAAGTAGLFHVVPNTFVRWRHAWAGAMFVAVGIEGAKVVLAWYVAAVPNFSAVYGAFATVPIMLLWIYLVWVVVLLGAVVAAYAPSLQMGLKRPDTVAGLRFELALAILRRLRAACDGTSRGLPLQQLSIDPLSLEEVAVRLTALDLVARLDEEGAQRLVLIGEPEHIAATPLLDALLVRPSAVTQPFRSVAGVEAMTLQQLLGPAATLPRGGR
jgi:membrane protein